MTIQKAKLKTAQTEATDTVLFLIVSLMVFKSSLNRFTDAINISISTSVHLPLTNTNQQHTLLTELTRMWANAQRDGRPAVEI